MSKERAEFSACSDFEDVISAGLEALVVSIELYDRVTGMTLQQFAWTRVNRAVLAELRRPAGLPARTALAGAEESRA